jgi:glycine cleavage system aminomethyltransferase T
VLTDVSALWSVLSVMGPRARELLARSAPTTCRPRALPSRHTKEIDLGHARVRAARMSYVGGPGFELYVPVEMARHVYLALHEAGQTWACATPATTRSTRCASRPGAVPGGRAGPRRDAASRPGWALPWRWTSRQAFIGRDALRAAHGRPLRKKLVSVVLDDPAHYAWGGEALSLDGQAVGELSSAGWGLRAGRCMGLAWLRGDAALQPHAGTAMQLDLWGQAVPVQAWDRWEPRP